MNPLKALALAGNKMIQPALKICKNLKINKPTVMVTTGVVAMAASFVWVAVEATKAPEAMAESAEKVKAIEDGRNEQQKEDTILTAEETKKLDKKFRMDLVKARADGAWQVGRLFLGPVLLMTFGAIAILKGHNILRKENIIIGAALKSTEQMFQFYRNNVVAAEGKEADLLYLRGVKGETEVSEIHKNPDGTEEIIKKKLPLVNGENPNPWRFEYSPTFFHSATGDPQKNLTHLLHVQTYFNHKYGGSKKYGRISMYEILEYLDPIWDALDADGTVEIFARNYGYGHDKHGDDFIDLGIYRAVNDSALKGRSDVVYIEFNCDGKLENLVNQYKEKYEVKKV